MNNYLPTDYQNFIATSRYARWIEAEKRRETWAETVSRFTSNVVGNKISDNSVIKEIEEAILNLEVMPSMRAVITAGPALDRDNTAGYNCSYLPVDDPKAFDEAIMEHKDYIASQTLAVSVNLMAKEQLKGGKEVDIDIDSATIIKLEKQF